MMYISSHSRLGYAHGENHAACAFYRRRFFIIFKMIRLFISNRMIQLQQVFYGNGSISKEGYFKLAGGMADLTLYHGVSIKEVVMI